MNTCCKLQYTGSWNSRIVLYSIYFSKYSFSRSLSSPGLCLPVFVLGICRRCTHLAQKSCAITWLAWSERSERFAEKIPKLWRVLEKEQNSAWNSVRSSSARIVGTVRRSNEIRLSLGSSCEDVSRLHQCNAHSSEFIYFGMAIWCMHAIV